MAESAKNRCAVVTGANKGIGFEICKQLASNGVKVVLTARDEKRGIDALEKFKGAHLFDLVMFHQLDVTDHDSVASLAQFVKEQFGKLDILVNNSGIAGVLRNEDAFKASGTTVRELALETSQLMTLQSSRFVKKDDKVVDLLASLCNMYETSEDQLRKTMVRTNIVVEEILKKDPSMASECQNGNLDNIDTDDLKYFQYLLKEQSLSSDLDILEKDYDDAMLLEGELDERLFISDEESLLGSSSLSGGAINMIGTKASTVQRACYNEAICQKAK